jgi:hypothetical protein
VIYLLDRKREKEPDVATADNPLKFSGGVAEALFKMLHRAGRKRPVTRRDAHARLVARFPDYDPDDLWVFVVNQLPNRLRTVRGLKLCRNAKSPRGYWIE